MSQKLYNMDDFNECAAKLRRAFEDLHQVHNRSEFRNNVIEGNFSKLTKEEELEEVKARS